MNLLLSFSGAIQMLTYETSKKLYDKLNIPQTELMEKNFLCGGIAKIGTVFFTYPFTTIRTRIQQNQYLKIHPNEQKYHNDMEIIAKTFRMEGMRGFYKGITANILRGIP
jgi:solute carrier family 25 folate transporter 32